MIRGMIAVSVMVFSGSLATADTWELVGKSLVCALSNAGYKTSMTAYVLKDRVFLYHGGSASKLGTIYEFGKEFSGTSGSNSYTSTGRISSGQIDLSRTVVNRTCGICDGKTIVQTDRIQISPSGNGWGATRDFEQRFEDGTPVAVPSGSESYSCRVAAGRVGVGR